MRMLFLMLALAGMAMAFTVQPDYFEIQDTGNQNLPKLNVGITLDCDTKAATVEVRSNETGLAVQGAKAYMFYTDYTYQALPNPGTTDADGKAVMQVPGTIRFLTALFIIRVDHKDFRSREIEYAYKKCFEPPPKPPLPEPPPEEKNETKPGTNITPPVNVTPPSNATNNTTTPSGNATPPQPGGTNASGDGEEKPPFGIPCPTGLILLSLLAFRSRA
jgi:hypothetical protein